MSQGFNAFDRQIEAIAEGEVTEQKLLEMLDRVRTRKELEELDGQIRKQLRRVIEGLLFASAEPISFRKLREIADTLYPVRPKLLLGLLTELRDEYRDQERAFQLEEIGQGFVLRTHESIGTYVEQLYRNKRTERLSSAATEVLSIIAHRQPVTRGQIDGIRGVDSSGTLQALVERGLVEVVGRAESVGRPSLYSVTPAFLAYFGYKDLTELPRLKTDDELAAAKSPASSPGSPRPTTASVPPVEASLPRDASAYSQTERAHLQTADQDLPPAAYVLSDDSPSSHEERLRSDPDVLEGSSANGTDDLQHQELAGSRQELLGALSEASGEFRDSSDHTLLPTP